MTVRNRELFIMGVAPKVGTDEQPEPLQVGPQSRCFLGGYLADLGELGSARPSAARPPRPPTCREPRDLARAGRRASGALVLDQANGRRVRQPAIAAPDCPQVHARHQHPPAKPTNAGTPMPRQNHDHNELRPSSTPGSTGITANGRTSRWA